MQKYQKNSLLTEEIKMKIFKYLRKIPKGKVTTYKFLSKKFNLHPRVIGRILSLNIQQDKYPCYKVIRSDGKIGGYNKGKEEKIRRLKKENILINNGRIDLKKYGWKG